MLLSIKAAWKSRTEPCQSSLSVVTAVTSPTPERLQERASERKLLRCELEWKENHNRGAQERGGGGGGEEREDDR